jgi:hypothetical protein
VAAPHGQHLNYGTQPPFRRRWLLVFVLAAALVAVTATYFVARDPVQRWMQRREYRKQAEAWYATSAASQPSTQPNPVLRYSDYATDVPSTTAFALSPTYTDAGPVLAKDMYPLVFAGERTNTLGQKRLIRVLCPGWEGNAIKFTTEQIGPISGGENAGMIHLLRRNFKKVDLTGVASKGELRLFAGEIDSTDPARFTIPFTAGRRAGRIVGVFAPGASTSTDPKLARIEAEANVDVTYTLVVDGDDPTSRPTSKPSGLAVPQ